MGRKPTEPFLYRQRKLSANLAWQMSMFASGSFIHQLSRPNIFHTWRMNDKGLKPHGGRKGR